MQNTPKRNSFYIPEEKYSINTTAANPRAVEQEAAVLLANRARDSFYGLVPLDTTAEEDTRSYALTLAKGVASNAAKMLVLDPYRQAKTLWRLADDRMAKGKAFWDEIRQAPQGLDAQETADYLNKRLPDLDARYEAARERSLKSVQLTRQKQERFLQTMHLTQDEKDNPYVYMFGAGAGSLAAGVLGGIYFKAPKAVSVLFGLNQAQNTWEEATENGVPRAKAALTATLAGSAEALLECVGLGRLEKAFEASKGVKRILGSALTEFLQEGSQQSAEETIMQTMGGRVQSGLDTFKSIALSAVMGAVLGGGAGGLHAAFARGVKRFEKLGAPKESARALAAKAVEAGTSKEMTEEAVRLVEDQENPVNWPDNDIIKGQEEFRKAAQKQDFAKAYDEIETRAKNKFKAQGLAEEEAALGAAVERNITQMQAAHLGLTPELAEKSLDISFNQELSESDAKIRFIGEMQKMSAAEQEAFYKTSKMASYQEMLGELNAYRAGLSENGETTDARQKPSGMTLERAGLTAEANGARTYAQAAAMYKNPASSLAEFVDFYNANKNNPKEQNKSFYRFSTPSGAEVDVPFNRVKHIDKKHQFTKEQWQALEQGIDNIDYAYYVPGTAGENNGIQFLCKVNTPEGKAGVTLEILPNGRVLLDTAVFDSEANIDNWAKNEPLQRPSLKKPVLVGSGIDNSIAGLQQFVKGLEFKEFNQGARGKTKITSKDGFIRAVITAGQAADKSTFVHEMAHVYLAAFEHVYGMEEYAAQRKHLDAWLGQPRGGVYSRAQQEKFAQGFEQFLKEGKAPAPYLKSVFEKFRAWIIHVYNGADISKLSAAAREAYADMLAGERNDAQKTVEFYQSNKKDYGRIRATLEKIKQDKLDIKDLDGVDLAALRDFVGILKKPAPALPKRTLLTDLRRYGAQYANSGQIDKEAYKNARVYDKATGVGDKPADWLVKHGYMEDADVQTYEEASARDQEACELIERALAGEPVYKLEDRERVELHDAYREAVNMAEDAIGADYKNYEKLLENMDALKKQGYRAVEKSDLDFIQEKFEELANLRESEAFLAQEESFGRVDDAKRGSADERRKDKTQKAKLENLRKAQAVKKAVLDELERRNLFAPAAREQNGKLKNELPPDAQPVIKLTGTEIPGLTKDVKTSKPAVLEWFKKALAPLTSKRRDLGEISYPVSSAREVLGKTKETEKIKLLPAVKAVVDNGILLNDGKMQETPNHTGGVVGFYYVQGAVDLDGKIKTVQVDIAQDRQGKKFYFYSEIKEAPIGGDTLSITRAAKGANNPSSSGSWSITSTSPEGINSITKNGDIFKAPAANKLAAVREELNKASTVEEIYKAADHAFLVMEDAYGNTEAGKAEAGRMAPPAQDWDARRVELLKDLADINKKTDANAAWAFAAIERGGLIAPHKSGITPQEWNAPAAVSDKQRKMNVWKAEQILDEQLRNRYYKAFEKALGQIEGLKGPQKSMLLREFNNIRYRNKNAPELIVKTLEEARKYVENNYKNYMAGKIEEIVKTPLFEKSGSLRTAKYSPAAQAFLKAAHRIVTLDKETARDSYAHAVENQNYDEALSKTQILQNRLLQLKAAPETMTPAEVKDVYGQMREIQKAGRDEVRLEKFLRNTREDIWRERLLAGLAKQKMPKGAVLYIKKLANWQSILNTLFGEVEVEAEVNGKMGKEKIKFMDSLSLEQNQIQMQNHVRALRQKVVERVGQAYGLKNGNEYIKKINELQSETYTLQNYGEIPEGPAELLTERQKKPFLQTITKLELLFFYIQDQNPLNRARLMRAYRQEQYETLFAPITAQDKKAAAALMQIAQSTYEQMNEVHKRERGFTLGRVENYFPNRTERLTGGLDYLREMLANNAAPSAIKARVQTVSAVEKPVNPVSLLMSEISRNAEYIYGAESAGKLRRIFRDKQMARALEEKFGKQDGRDIYEHLIKMIDLNGPGARNAEKTQFFEKMEFLFNNWVKSAIGLKPIVAIKQFASAFNYAENMPVAAWTAGFKDALLHPRETLRFMREFSPYLVTRYEEGGMNETLGRALSQDEMFGTADKINTLTNAITTNVRLGDMFALAFGGKPYVDWLMKEKGYSPQAAREAFELATVRAQQANLKSTLNEAQMSGGNLFWRAAWAFRNQQMQYARKLYDAYVDYKNGYIGEKDMAKKVFMYAVVQPALYTLLSLGWFAADDDDRKDDWWRLAASPVEQTLGAVPFGDDAAELLFNNLRSLCEDGKLTGLRVYELPGVADMYRTFNKLVSNFNSGDADLGDWLDCAAEMGQFSGFGTKQLKTQLSGLYDAAEGKPVKGAMKVIGYTQNRANKVTGDDDE